MSDVWFVITFCLDVSPPPAATPTHDSLPCGCDPLSKYRRLTPKDRFHRCAVSSSRIPTKSGSNRSKTFQKIIVILCFCFVCLFTSSLVHYRSTNQSAPRRSRDHVPARQPATHRPIALRSAYHVTRTRSLDHTYKQYARRIRIWVTLISVARWR